jgi:hypothetical protein
VKNSRIEFAKVSLILDWSPGRAADHVQILDMAGVSVDAAVAKQPLRGSAKPNRSCSVHVDMASPSIPAQVGAAGSSYRANSMGGI